jgi:hypothetical protein
VDAEKGNIIACKLKHYRNPEQLRRPALEHDRHAGKEVDAYGGGRSLAVAQQEEKEQGSARR